jgi:localization factor PodJL
MIAARGGDAQAEAAVVRLAPTVSAEARTKARTEADAFDTEALG